MIFLMRASGSACGPVRADTPPQKIPEYGLASLMLVVEVIALAVAAGATIAGMKRRARRDGCYIYACGV